MMDLMKKLTESQLKENAVNFGIGDTVRVHAKIKEGNRERIQ
ncbi:MAG: 50S ribosomal protein L19, partial [Clostridia bacterium]|nr:50S ribosomal protein L19 [Clostridia bacterium]